MPRSAAPEEIGVLVTQTTNPPWSFQRPLRPIQRFQKSEMSIRKSRRVLHLGIVLVPSRLGRWSLKTCKPAFCSRRQEVGVTHSTSPSESDVSATGAGKLLLSSWFAMVRKRRRLAGVSLVILRIFISATNSNPRAARAFQSALPYVALTNRISFSKKFCLALTGGGFFRRRFCRPPPPLF
jgi:hypothetical protein